MSVHDRRQGAGLWWCEWAGCSHFATTKVRTIDVPWLMVCSTHRQEWDGLPYGHMLRVSAARQGAQFEPKHSGGWVGPTMARDVLEGMSRVTSRAPEPVLSGH